MLNYLKNIIKRRRYLYNFILLIMAPYRRYLDTQQRKIYEKWENRQTLNQPINKKIDKQPLISIIVPTYNTPVKYLRDMIKSVEGQSYDNWELIIVDDASPNDDVKHEIRKIAKNNTKIKPFFLKTNRHIAGATNYGINKANGEYIGLLDHDDMLHKDALLLVVNKINELPGVKFIYTDEVKLDEKGRQYQPFFKPDWNIDFLRSINYITHFAIIQRDFLIELGGEDGVYNGTQDWELFLRATRTLKSSQIAHIPKILYYWRVHNNSTAGNLDAKPYVIGAQKKALTDDIKKRHMEAEVVRDSLYGAQWCMRYSSPSQQDVTVNNILFSRDDSVGNVLSRETSDVIIFSNSSVDYSGDYSLLGDIFREDIGAVIPRIYDESQVVGNLKSILDEKIVKFIHELSRRSFTKHIYLTSKYNLKDVCSSVLFIERKKLSLIDQSTKIDSQSLTKALCNKGFRTLYNPYITIKEN